MMTPKFKWLTVGAAIVAVAGTAALANTMHHLTMKLPEGGTETIEYSGDIAPRMTFSKPSQDSAGVRVWAPFEEMERVSAMMDEMAADMDRQMQVSLQQMQRLAPGMTYAGLAALPPDSESYSVTTISSGKGVCIREVRITSSGDGMKPQMFSQSSGCGNQAGPEAERAKATTIRTMLENATVPRQHI